MNPSESPPPIPPGGLRAALDVEAQRLVAESQRQAVKVLGREGTVLRRLLRERLGVDLPRTPDGGRVVVDGMVFRVRKVARRWGLYHEHPCTRCAARSHPIGPIDALGDLARSVRLPDDQLASCPSVAMYEEVSRDTMIAETARDLVSMILEDLDDEATGGPAGGRSR
jgi:hypothetical protein